MAQPPVQKSRIDELILAIQKELSLKGWSKRQIAERAKLHPNTLLNLDTAEWNPALETLRKIDTALTQTDAAEKARR